MARHSEKLKSHWEGAQHVKHTRIGVWDFYVEQRQTNLPRIPGISGSSVLETWSQMVETMPYAVRMSKDVLSIKRIQMLLPIYLVVEVLRSLIPAVSLWCFGQLLRLIPTVIETHTVDSTNIINVAVIHLACEITTRLLAYAEHMIVSPMDRSIKQFYAGHIFRSKVRLDLPTFRDSAIGAQFSTASPLVGKSVAWRTIEVSTGMITSVIRTLSQLLVLFTMMWEQQDGLLLTILGCSRCVVFLYMVSIAPSSSKSVWAATTTDQDYIRMHGLESLAHYPSHRKELVAGNLSEFITAQYRESTQRIGEDGGDCEEMYRSLSVKKRLIVSVLHILMRDLPQIIFTLRVIQKPSMIILSLVSFISFGYASNSFCFATLSLSPIVKQFDDIRTLYEIENIPNKVVDGVEPFPEDKQSLRSGISVEFRNVSFRYPDTEKYALRDVSFKLEAGQLCVIVGMNGSGKSTILKLICRIYDPTDGTILIDNHDIKSLRLADLRASMSILFQDYTHFPLSIRENIGLGNPTLAHDDDKIREAAHLGGAADFIDELPDGFNTYVRRPVSDHYSDPFARVGTSPVRPGDKFSLVRRAGGLRVTENLGLSGGQMQRLAVSRTFMRSLVTETESSAGMLLFDEPSASLDPTAEHNLFERLRMLRGSKTMVFSTHRFGNLTRQADLVLYMDGSVQEQGTHDELVQYGGEYARNWGLLAKPFL